MRKLIKLNNSLNIKFDSKINEYINPEKLYIEILPNFDLLVKQNDKVLKGDILLQNKLNKIKSPISGNIIGTTIINNKNYLVILNNYEEKDKYYTKKRIDKFNKENIINILYEYGYSYYANIFETKKINNLIINGMEDEPYIENNPFIINKYSKEILELCDILSNAFDFKNSYICVKSDDTSNIEIYLNKIGTYPNIKFSLIENKYLLANSFFLLENMNLSMGDSLVINAEDALNLYNALKNYEIKTTKYITISSPFLTKSKVIHVKIGTSLSDILENNISIKENNLTYIYNGLMTGYEVNPKDIIIDNNTKGVIIIKKDLPKEEECNLCGMCYKICPVKVNPKKVMDTNKKSKNCIDCGLCSYICPCKINLRKYLRGKDV